MASTDAVIESDGEDTPNAGDEAFERMMRRLEAVGVLTESRRMEGVAEQSMLRTLATPDRPLRHPEDFPRAHRGLARGFEAIIVNGTEPPTLSPRLGPLRPLFTTLVGLVSTALIRSQTRALLNTIRRMYALREANSEWGSPEHRMLTGARTQLQTLSEDVNGGRFGLPLFLLSGAFLSGLISASRTLLDPVLHDRLLSAVLVMVVVILLVLVAGIVLLGTSIARMRIRLALKAPIDTLYRTIGSTGRQPRDRCYTVAFVALVLFVFAAIAIPSGVYLLLHR